MATTISVDAWVDGNDPDAITESWQRDQGPKAVVRYRCAWGDRYQLAQDLLGGYNAGAQGLFDYEPPYKYPPSPNLYAWNITEIRGTEGVPKNGSRSKWSPWTQALVVCEFQTPQWAVDINSATENPATQIDPNEPIVGCKQEISASSAFRLLPKQKLEFDSGTEIEDQEATRLEAQTEITLEFPRVPRSFYRVLKPYLGHINTVALFHHDPGELLFDNMRESVQSTLGFGSDRSLVLTFLGRDASWNKLPNADGDMELIKFKGTSPVVRPYPEADLREIFV